MPNRIAHEKACNSPTLDVLSDGAERLFWRAMTKADDYGRFDADPRVLLGACFPLRIGKMRPVQVQAWRDELVAAGAWALYEVGGHVYGHFTGWLDHQRKRDSRPKFPEPSAGQPIDPFTPENQEESSGCGESPQVAANGGDSPLARAGMHARPSGVVIRESLTTGSRESGAATSGGESPPTAASAALPSRKFKIPEAIEHALDRAPVLGAVPKLRTPAYWQAQLRAHGQADFPAEILKAEAWMQANPQKAARRDHPRFLHNWLAKAHEDAR